MTQDITSIITAAAAVIGLVPLGVGTVVGLVKGRRKKKSIDQVGTVVLSVLLSLIAPGVLGSVVRHMAAVRDVLPDWVTAAVPEAPPDGQQPPSVNGSASAGPDRASAGQP